MSIFENILEKVKTKTNGWVQKRGEVLPYYFLLSSEIIPHKEMESLVGSSQVFVLTTLSRPEDGASTVQVAVAGHLAELYAVLCVLLLVHSK